MKAVYESSTPYYSVGYWDINGVSIKYGYEYLGDGKYSNKRIIVGNHIDLPDSESERNRFYTFLEGKKHNQLTLVDPVEIYNMRAWLNYHPDFKEVSCEDVPEDLQEYLQSLKREEPEKAVQADHKRQDTDSEDWDRVMAKRIMK